MSCKFCKGEDKMELALYDTVNLSINKNVLEIEIEVYGSGCNCETEINYCPICGERIK